MYNLIEIKKMKKVLFAIVMVGALLAACTNSTDTTVRDNFDTMQCDSVKCDSMNCDNKCDSTQCDSTCEVKK